MLRQLEYLVAVADTGHFHRAADRAHTSQPTLSEQLKALETRLGVQLVERTRSKVMLTAVGAEVAEIGRRMLRDAQQIRELTSRCRRSLDGSICIGLLQTIGAPLLARILPILCGKFPQLTLQISEDISQALLSGLDEGIYDIVLAPLPVRKQLFSQLEILQEPLYLCVPIDHPLAKCNRVRPADLRGLEILSLSPRLHLHDLVADLATRFGAKLKPDYEINGLDTLHEMIGANLGVSFLPGLYVQSVSMPARSFAALEIEGCHLSRSIGMLWRKSNAHSTTFERLAKLIGDSLRCEFGALAQHRQIPSPPSKDGRTSGLARRVQERS